MFFKTRIMAYLTHEIKKVLKHLTEQIYFSQRLLVAHQDQDMSTNKSQNLYEA